jgi:phosphatidylserine/phosphatidylglycerophosphate/cardiolipin synthase-like enzyme
MGLQLNPFLRRLANFGKLPLQPTMRRVRQWNARRTLGGDRRRQSRGAVHLPSWAREPQWYGAGTPPRQHNRVTSLIDGEAYFGRLHNELLNAQQSVYIMGWCCTPQFPLLRDSDQAMLESRFADVLARVASRLPVRVLLWAGSPALYPPTQEFAEAAAREFNSIGSPNLVCRLDDTRSGTRSHHQKAVVIDGHLVFIAGIDVTMLDGDRWDRTDHPLRMGPTWHDAGVLLEGEAVRMSSRTSSSGGRPSPESETSRPPLHPSTRLVEQSSRSCGPCQRTRTPISSPNTAPTTRIPRRSATPRATSTSKGPTCGPS